MPPKVMYSRQSDGMSLSGYAERNSEKDSGRTRTSSPLPRNSVRMSEDRNLELLPVM